MTSLRTSRFWKAYHALDAAVQKQAEEAYRDWSKNPYEPSLRFKQIHPNKPYYSVSIGLNWRALGEKEDDETIVWYWIGSHEAYNGLVGQIRKRKSVQR